VRAVAAAACAKHPSADLSFVASTQNIPARTMHVDNRSVMLRFKRFKYSSHRSNCTQKSSTGHSASSFHDFSQLSCCWINSLRMLLHDRSQKVKGLTDVCSSSWKSILELRSVTCHMGSYKVICHLTQLNALRYR